PLGAMPFCAPISMVSLRLHRVSRERIRCSLRVAFFNCKGQQDISGHRIRISGVHKQHSTDDRRASPVQGTSVCGYSIGGLEDTVRVKVPNHVAGLCVIGSKMPIERPGKQNSRNQSRRSHLSGTAAILSNTERLHWIDVPNWFSFHEVEG